MHSDKLAPLDDGPTAVPVTTRPVPTIEVHAADTTAVAVQNCIAVVAQTGAEVEPPIDAEAVPIVESGPDEEELPEGPVTLVGSE